MSRRLNISLPDTIKVVTRHVVEVGRARLRKRMKERAVKRANLDLHIAEEWFPVDEEALNGHKK